MVPLSTVSSVVIVQGSNTTNLYGGLGETKEVINGMAQIGDDSPTKVIVKEVCIISLSLSLCVCVHVCVYPVWKKRSH